MTVESEGREESHINPPEPTAPLAERPKGVLRPGPVAESKVLRIGLTRVQLRFTRGGNVLPWLGPALRGVVAMPLRRQACRFDILEQQGRWRYCGGCPHMTECAYGLLFEPDPMGLPTPARGADLAPSGVVLSPGFPIPAKLRMRDRLNVDVVLTGPAANDHCWSMLSAAIADAGRENGLGPEHVRFEMECPTGMEWLVLSPDMFPDSSSLPGGYPRLRIDIATPLFFRGEPQANGRRAPNLQPTFVDLFRPAMRTIRRLFAQSGVAIDRDWSALCQLASMVNMIDSAYVPFRQRRFSSRTEHRAELDGVVGTGWFSHVPAVLLPWLYWGGRLHLGRQRVAGAGRLRLTLE